MQPLGLNVVDVERSGDKGADAMAHLVEEARARRIEGVVEVEYPRVYVREVGARRRAPDAFGPIALAVGTLRAHLVAVDPDRAAEIRLEEIGPVEPGAGEVGTAQIGAEETGAPEIGAFERGTGQVRLGEVRADQARAGPARIHQDGIGELGAPGVSRGEVGPREVRARKEPIAQHGAGEVNVDEVPIVQKTTLPIDARLWRIGAGGLCSRRGEREHRPDQPRRHDAPSSNSVGHCLDVSRCAAQSPFGSSLLLPSGSSGS